MRLVAEDAVAHVVIMRGLDVVEEDDVFQLHGVADDGVLADDGAAADKGTVADLRAVVDNAGSAEPGGGENLRILRHPHAFTGLVIFFGVKRGAEFENECLDLVQHLPGIGLALEELFGDRFVQIEEILDFYHIISPVSAFPPPASRR